MNNNRTQDKLERITGISTQRLSAGVRRVLGLDRLEFALFNGLGDFRDQIRRKIDRLMGKSLPSKRMRLCRAFAIDQLETRMMLSATWGDTDGVMTWTDDSGTTQALDVTSGSVEVYFTDDVGNTGDITEIRFLSGAGFDITTSNIDLINSNGKDVQVLNIGVNVGSELADTGGKIDNFQADYNVFGPVLINGDVDSLTIVNQLEGTLTVTGDVKTFTVDRIMGNADVTIGGDLDTLTANRIDDAQIVADNVIGAFELSVGPGGSDFYYSNTFGSPTQVTFEGLTNTLSTGSSSNNVPTVQDATFNLAENAVSSTSVGTVSASDPDSGDTLTYSISGGNAAGVFAINSSTGEITVADSTILDFETTGSYALSVRVSDGENLSNPATVTVNVTDIVEDYTTGMVAQWSFDETTGTTADDAIGNLDGTLTNMNGTEWSLGYHDGSLSFDGVDDYVSTNTDMGQWLNGTATVAAWIKTTQTGSVQSYYSPSIIGNEESGGVNDVRWGFIDDQGRIGVTVRDDFGARSAVAVNDGQWHHVAFTRDATTGEVKVYVDGTLSDTANGSTGAMSGPLYDIGRTLDYNGTDTSYFQGGLDDVRIYDSALTAGEIAQIASASTPNKAPTAFDATFSLPENATNATSLGTVSASDPNNGDSLSYAITAGNAAGVFAINSSTGEITVANNSTLDFETTASYSLTVQVTDAGTLTDTATVTVNVTNINETPSVSNASFSLAENATNSSSLGSVSASDPDSGDTLTYAITAGNAAGVFAINSSTGEITVADNSSLDFETTASYSLTVQVTDGGSLTDTATVTVNVTNINETPSVSAATFSLAENAANAASLGTVSASDPDSGDALSYAITAGNGAGVFAINSSTGEITVADNSTLDFETTSAYTLTVQVTDSGSLTGTATVTVNVTNINETPMAVDDSYTTDEDSLLSSNTTWADSDWQYRRLISFDNSTRSENLTDFPVLITLNSSTIDYAQTQDQGQDLRFYDADGNSLAYEIETWDESGTSRVWVKVPQIDANSNNDYIHMYYGNASAADAQNTQAVWSDYRAVYHLDGDPGAVGTVIDSAGNYNVTNAGSTDAAGYIGNAQDFDGSTQYIDLGSDRDWINNANAVTGSVWMNADTISGYGTLFGVTTNGSNVLSRFELRRAGNDIQLISRTMDDDSDRAFSIYTNTQPLTVAKWHLITGTVDYASDVDNIRIYVDGKLEGTFSHNFTLDAIPNTNSTAAALGANENGSLPLFDGRLDEARIATKLRSADWVSAQYAAMTGNLASIGSEQTVAGVVSNDIDFDRDVLTVTEVNGNSAAVNNQITLPSGALLTLNTDGSFVWNPNGMYESLAAGDQAFDTFTYTVDDGNGGTDTATVTITINGANDTPSISAATFSLAENAANSSSLGTVSASDPDSGDTLSYAITDGNAAGVFAINSSTGEITIADNSSLDFETTASYALTVRVTDGGSLTETAAVTVNVTDVINNNDGNGNGNGNNSHTHVHTTANGQTHNHNHASAHTHTHSTGFIDGESTLDNGASTTSSDSEANASFDAGSPAEQLRVGASVLQTLNEATSGASAETNATGAGFSQISTDNTNIDLVFSESNPSPATGDSVSDTSDVASSKGEDGKKGADASGQTAGSKTAAASQVSNGESGTTSVTSTHEQSGTPVAGLRLDSPSAASSVAPLTTIVDTSLGNALMNGTEALFSQLDNMARDMESPVNMLLDTPLGQVVIATTVTAAAGYVLFDIGKLPLLVGAFSAMAHWRQFDLLGILDDSEDKRSRAGGGNARTLMELVG